MTNVKEQSMAARTMLAVGLIGAAAGLLAGCGEPAPIVEFTTPRVNMHLEGKQIREVQVTGSDEQGRKPAVERVDDKYYRVVGAGQVRVVVEMMDTHVVRIFPDHIRVHGVDVPAGEVFVQSKEITGEGVHVGHVKKP